ncbi:MAG: LysE family translocator, partial [Pseudomonadota bacterium]
HSPSFWGGYVLAIANPKAFAAFASATAAVTIAPASPTTDAAAKFATLAVMIWSINTSWLLFGSVFSGALARPHTARVVNLVFAALLLVSVGIAFWPAI